MYFDIFIYLFYIFLPKTKSGKKKSEKTNKRHVPSKQLLPP